MTNACKSLMLQSADQQKVSCLGMKGPTCAFQGLSQIQQCWEGGGESNVTRPEYSERHDLIRNTCYSCSLIPLCLHSRPKIKRSPLLSQHQGKLKKKPWRRVTNHLQTLSFPVGSQRAHHPLPTRHLPCRGENHANLHSCVVLFWAFCPAFFTSPVALGLKNPPPNAGDVRDRGSIPGSGRFPGGGHGNPLQYLCLENPMDRGARQATYSP